MNIAGRNSARGQVGVPRYLPTTGDRRYVIGWELATHVDVLVVARAVYPPQLTGRTGW